MHLWHDNTPGPAAPDVVSVVVEIFHFFFGELLRH